MYIKVKQNVRVIKPLIKIKFKKNKSQFIQSLRILTSIFSATKANVTVTFRCAHVQINRPIILVSVSSVSNECSRSVLCYSVP